MTSKITGYAGFLPAGERPNPTLKPGQAYNSGTGFYSEAAVIRPSPASPTRAADCMKSTYGQMLEHLQPAEYGSAPADKARSRDARQKVSGNDDERGNLTSHWRSTNHVDYSSQKNFTTTRVTKPAWLSNKPKEAEAVSRGTLKSGYHEEFGAYGSNPRDKLPQVATSYAASTSPLHLGTTKAVARTAGYQGFIPANASAFSVAGRHGRGEEARDMSNRDNITENYHQNIPGYTGHVASSATNDLGPKSPNFNTTMGAAFNLK
eukprot:GILJ01001513.1.p1 GENE.GILJ01001513.1~~GILJ01001513.1.p1  ORF type:complete len:289 (+),score=15.29 GILJ01001513.1:80-868(+)